MLIPPRPPVPLKLHQLRALVAIADLGSINSAAKFLCLSQPAITQAIRDLEAGVGVTLLARTNSGVTVTQRGKSLLRHARLIVSELERAEEHMLQESGSLEGKIVVGLMPLAAVTILPKAYARFRKEMPRIRVEFIELPVAGLLNGLRSGTLDIAIASPVASFLDASISHIDLTSIPATLAVRRGSPLAKAKTLAELADAEWLYSDTTDSYAKHIVALFQDHGLEPPRRMTRCTSQALLYNLVLEMDAVITAWALRTTGALNIADKLITLDFVPARPPMALKLLQSQGAIQTPASEHFMRCIFEVVREDFSFEQSCPEPKQS